MKPKITLAILNELYRKMQEFGRRYCDLHGGRSHFFTFFDDEGIHFDDFPFDEDSTPCWCQGYHGDDLLISYHAFVRYLKDPDKYFEKDEKRKKRWEVKQLEIRERQKRVEEIKKKRWAENKERKERELYERLKEKYGSN